MFAALALSAALGAPVPAPAAPVPTGPAPRVMELKAGPDGKVMVAVTRTTEKAQVPPVAGPNGAPPAVVIRETTGKLVELGEVKDLAVTTADGKKVEVADALKQVAGGAVVIVSADGKPVSPAFLKVFKDDTLVLASPELTGPQGGLLRPGRPLPVPLPAVPPGGVQILPAVPAGAPAVIQVQVVPGGVQVVPALPVAPPVPAPLPAPAPEKVEK